jgi:hypothetical protein
VIVFWVLFVALVCREKDVMALEMVVGGRGREGKEKQYAWRRHVQV